MDQETLLAYGGAVKRLEGNRIGGYLARFTGPDDTDLEGDFFTSDTKFGKVTNPDLLWNHTMDAKVGDRVIGEGTLTKTDAGLWFEGVLEERDEYEKYIARLVDMGKAHLSSGAVGHMVRRERVGKSWQIKSWPIYEASLTHTPAEPRNVVTPIKSFKAEPLTPADGEPDAASETAGEPAGKGSDVYINLYVKLTTDTDMEEKETVKTSFVTQEAPSPAPDNTDEIKAIKQSVADLTKAFRESKTVTAPLAAPTPIKSSSLGDDPVKALASWFRSGSTTDVKHLLEDGEGGVRLIIGEKSERMFEDLSPTKAAKLYAARRAVKASNAVDMQFGTAGEGGNAVPTGHYQGIIARRDEMTLWNRLGCRVITGKGTTVNVPLDAEADGEWITKAEEASYDVDSPALGTTAMTLVKYTKNTNFTKELLEDEDSNLLAFIEDFVGRGMAKTENALLATEVAAGGTQGKRFTGGTAIAAGELETLMFSGEMAYYLDDGGSIAWVTRPNVYAAVASLTGNTRLYSPDNLGVFRQSILGYPVYFSNKVTTPAARAKSIWFGNWYYMGVRHGQEVSFLRDPYSKASTGQIAFWYDFRAVYKTLQAEAILYGEHSLT